MLTLDEVSLMMTELAELSKLWNPQKTTLHINKCKCSICPMQDDTEVALQEKLTALMEKDKTADALMKKMTQLEQMVVAFGSLGEYWDFQHQDIKLVLDPCVETEQTQQEQYFQLRLTNLVMKARRLKGD